MKNIQNSTSALSALLRTTNGGDTLETNSLCCAAAGIIAPSSATAEALVPHEKLRGAALVDATLTAPERPLAQPVVGYTHALNNENAVLDMPDPAANIVQHLDKLAWLLAEGILILKDRNPDDANWFVQAEAALDLIHKQGITSNLPLENDAAVEAIQFALANDEGLAFLRCWNEGDFQAIRDEWPEAPEEVFIGADPLHGKEHRA